MMPRGRAAWAWLMLAAAALCSPAGGEERPVSGIPQLLVLDRFVGTWDVEVSVKPGPLVRGGAKVQGRTVNAWVDGGRILRQAWSIQSAEGQVLLSGQTDLTYDPQKKIFRNKTVPKPGVPSESEGGWDEKTRTLTWTSRDSKTKTTAVSRTTAVRDGLETWTMVIADGNGRPVFECSGTNTRRKN